MVGVRHRVMWTIVALLLISLLGFVGCALPTATPTGSLRTYEPASASEIRETMYEALVTAWLEEASPEEKQERFNRGVELARQASYQAAMNDFDLESFRAVNDPCRDWAFGTPPRVDPAKSLLTASVDPEQYVVDVEVLARLPFYGKILYIEDSWLIGMKEDCLGKAPSNKLDGQ